MSRNILRDTPPLPRPKPILQMVEYSLLADVEKRPCKRPIETGVVRFMFPDSRHYIEVLESRTSPGSVEIRCGDGRLVVVPCVTNVISVEVRDLLAAQEPADA